MCLLLYCLQKGQYCSSWTNEGFVEGCKVLAKVTVVEVLWLLVMVLVGDLEPKVITGHGNSAVADAALG
jgi:hypothetical protein